MSIGSNLKKIRESKGIYQVVLANYLGITEQAVSSWECDINAPRTQTLLKIAQYFNIPVSSILDEEITVYSLNKEIEALSPEKRKMVQSYIDFLNHS